jgi:uncharacterized cupin superfamily protein
MAGRDKRPLGDLFGLTNFGVNVTRLAPGGHSALRHAHTKQDELVYILEGRPTLVTDAGRMVLQPGMCAGFKGEAATPIASSTKPVRTSSISKSAIAPLATPRTTRTTTWPWRRSMASVGWRMRTARRTERRPRKVRVFAGRRALSPRPAARRRVPPHPPAEKSSLGR